MKVIHIGNESKSFLDDLFGKTFTWCVYLEGDNHCFKV